MVLVGASCLRPALGVALIETLAARFRVIVPDVSGGPPSGGGDLEWLAPFLEGLGLLGAGVVAAGPFGTAASALALEAPDHVSRVVILDEPGRTGARGNGEAGDPAPRAGAGDGAERLLRLRATERDRQALLNRITAFLSEAAIASPA